VDCEVLSETGRDFNEPLDWAVDENETDEEPVEIGEAVDDREISFEADKEVDVVREIVNDRD
jgi:hypothetical protein